MRPGPRQTNLGDESEYQDHGGSGTEADAENEAFHINVVAQYKRGDDHDGQDGGGDVEYGRHFLGLVQASYLDLPDLEGQVDTYHLDNDLVAKQKPQPDVLGGREAPRHHRHLLDTIILPGGSRVIASLVC